MMDWERAIESGIETLQWIVAGTVVAMVVPVARSTSDLLTIALIMLLALVIAAPTNHLLKWVEIKLKDEMVADGES